MQQCKQQINDRELIEEEQSEERSGRERETVNTTKNTEITEPDSVRRNRVGKMCGNKKWRD